MTKPETFETHKNKNNGTRILTRNWTPLRDLEGQILLDRVVFLLYNVLVGRFNYFNYMVKLKNTPKKSALVFSQDILNIDIFCLNFTL